FVCVPKPSHLAKTHCTEPADTLHGISGHTTRNQRTHYTESADTLHRISEHTTQNQRRHYTESADTLHKTSEDTTRNQRTHYTESADTLHGISGHTTRNQRTHYTEPAKTHCNESFKLLRHLRLSLPTLSSILRTKCFSSKPGIVRTLFSPIWIFLPSDSNLLNDPEPWRGLRGVSETVP
ncbi:hypothetical protein HispidOSU_016164, partial [Sigmodon hispidus]